MAGYEFQCDVNLALARQQLVRDPRPSTTIGYVTAIRIDSVDLNPDLAVFNPLAGNVTHTTSSANPAGTVKAVAVMEQFSWPGGAGAPMKVLFRASEANAAKIKELTSVTKPNVIRTFFGIVGFRIDPQSHEPGWIEEFSHAEPLSAHAAAVDISPAPVAGMNINFFRVGMQLLPAPGGPPTNLKIATGPGQSVAINWGSKVEGAASGLPPGV